MTTIDALVQPTTVTAEFYGFGSSGGGAATVFVFNSDGTQENNRYNDWDDLFYALDNIDGPKIVQFEQDETFPAQAVDLNNATLHGNGLPAGNGALVLTFPTGCTVTGWHTLALTTGIVAYSTSTSPITTVTGSDAFYVENDAYFCAKTAPFFDCTTSGASGIILFTFRHGSGLALPSDLSIAGGDYEAVRVNVGTGPVVFVDAAGPNGLRDDVIRGAGSAVRVSANPSLVSYGLDPALGDTQTNAADWTVQVISDSSRVAYDNTTSGLTATDVKAALDELAGGGGGTGDVVGPASATANSLARFDGTTGKLLKNGAVIGTDVQAYDADLAAIAGLSPSNDDIIQRKSGAWTNRTAAQVAADLDAASAWNPRPKYKNADQTVTSSTTVVNDDTLTFAIGASETWYIEWNLICSGGSTGDIKVTVTMPSGAASELIVDGAAVGGTTTPVFLGTITSSASSEIASGLQAGASNRNKVTIEGTVFNSTNAGNVTLQWAQNTSDGTATNVRKGSTMVYRRLA